MRSDQALAYTIFALTSLSLLLAAAIVHQVDPNGLLSTVLKDIGIVTGAVALIDVIWNRFGGSPLSQEIRQLKQLNTLMQDSEVTGLVHAFGRAADVRSADWLTLIQRADRRIDFSGHTLYQIAERAELGGALVEKARRGVIVRILMNHPKNAALAQAVDPEYGNLRAMQEQMTHTWNYFQGLRSRLEPQSRDNLLVARVPSGVLHLALRRFDGTMYVMPYLYSHRSPDSPVFVVEGEGKSLFETYTREFDRLLNYAELASDVQEAREIDAGSSGPSAS